MWVTGSDPKTLDPLEADFKDGAPGDDSEARFSSEWQSIGQGYLVCLATKMLILSFWVYLKGITEDKDEPNRRTYYIPSAD